MGAYKREMELKDYTTLPYEKTLEDDPYGEEYHLHKRLEDYLLRGKKITTQKLNE